MKYFVSAIDQDSADWIAQEIDAADFDDALTQLRTLMLDRWGECHGRETSVTEVPAAGENIKRRLTA